MGRVALARTTTYLAQFMARSGAIHGAIWRETWRDLA
jgi:hypothetical protein